MIKHEIRQGNMECGKNFSLAPLALVLMGIFPSINGYAQNYFNPAFLSGDTSAVADLSRFEGNGQAPGVYRVDVSLNGTYITTRDIQFESIKKINTTAPNSNQDDTGLTACLTPKWLDSVGVNTQAIPELSKAEQESCVDIQAALPGAETVFDFERLQLNISIPQAVMRNSARGYIPPEMWDNGINALLLNYAYSGSNSRNHGNSNSTTSNDNFLGLNSGVNIGPWRLRDYSTWNYSSSAGNDKGRWDHINTYIEREIIPLKSELVVGDSYTPSDVFDSQPFRGVQISSDDNMLPDSLRGFAPTVHGIAKSNAQVTIKQNGYTIYQSYVPPGAFTITDLFATTSSGDLIVEVKEADGSVSNFSVPYSAVPVLQREGRIKYSLTAARYRSSNNQQEETNFAQATMILGLPRGFTLYGGSQLSDKYSALAVGGGVNMGNMGAISFDITQAHSSLADKSSSDGQSIRFLYAKTLNELGTNVQLLGYRYSTSGFYTFDETTYKHMNGFTVDTDDENNGPDWASYYNLYNTKRGKIQINISQQLGEGGSLFVNGSQQTYWHTDKKDSLLQVGYSGSAKGISYSLTYNYNKMVGSNESDQIYAFNISLPLGQWLAPQNSISQSNNAYATYGVSTDKHGNTSQTTGLSGTLLEQNNLSYSVQQGYQSEGSSANGSAGLEYSGGYGDANIAYSYSNNGDYQQVNYGMRGGAVVHHDGITLSQPLGDTNVLIAAPGASGVEVESESGVSTDWRGYTVVPYATSYRQNRIALDTNTLKDNVDIDDAVINVVPTQGAIVRATYKAHVGLRALLTLMHNNKPIPFGAVVSRSDNGGDALVGDTGEVYLSGLVPQGILNVQWGNSADKKCQVNYQLPVNSNPLARKTLECL